MKATPVVIVAALAIGLWAIPSWAHTSTVKSVAGRALTSASTPTEGPGRVPWPPKVAEGPGRVPWPPKVAEGPGRVPWPPKVAEGPGRVPWPPKVA